MALLARLSTFPRLRNTARQRLNTRQRNFGFNEAAMNSSRKGHLYNRHVFKEFRGILREPSLR